MVNSFLASGFKNSVTIFDTSYILVGVWSMVGLSFKSLMLISSKVLNLCALAVEKKHTG